MKNIIKNGCLLVVFGLMMVAGARAQHDSINYTDANGLKQGKWVEYDTIAGKKYKIVGYFKDNFRDSVTNSYHPNGNLQCRMYFKKGNIDGVAHYFWNDGTIWIISVYNNDSLMWKMEFTEQGYPSYEASEGNKGIIHYKNGKWEDAAAPPDTTAANFTDANGLKQGKWFTKDTTDGLIIRIIGYYKDNLRDSVWNYYYPNGNIESCGYFKGGKIDVAVHIFSEKGTIFIISVYKDGNKIWVMVFDGQGCPSEEKNIVNDEIIGYDKGKWVYENGKLLVPNITPKKK